MFGMRFPFGQWGVAADKLGATAERAGEVVRDSLGLLIGVAVVGVTALILSIIAIVYVRGER